MKYIDADKFIKKFEKMIDDIPASVDSGAGYVIDEVYKIFDYLQQEQPEEICHKCIHHGKDDGYCYYPYGGMQSRINENGVYDCTGFCEKEQEQPQVADASKMEQEVDLEKEIDKGIADYSFTKTIDLGGFKTTVIDYAKIARHFYELGLKARKEK